MSDIYFFKKVTGKNCKRKICEGVLCIFVCMVFLGCGRNSKQEFEEFELAANGLLQTETMETVGMAEMTETSEGEHQKALQEKECYLYICGEVKNPGVYRLSQGKRLVDAIALAGGFTDEADENYWNLAEPVTDGIRILVPSKEEAAQTPSKDEPFSKAESPSDDENGKININTADASELTRISGIGESRARSIVEYRTEHGNFSSIEEIKNVSGIGDALFQKMKDFITVKN